MNGMSSCQDKYSLVLILSGPVRINYYLIKEIRVQYPVQIISFSSIHELFRHVTRANATEGCLFNNPLLSYLIRDLFRLCCRRDRRFEWEHSHFVDLIKAFELKRIKIPINIQQGIEERIVQASSCFPTLNQGKVNSLMYYYNCGMGRPAEKKKGGIRKRRRIGRFGQQKKFGRSTRILLKRECGGGGGAVLLKGDEHQLKINNNAIPSEIQPPHSTLPERQSSAREEQEGNV